MFGGDGLLQKGLELFLGQRDGVGQQLLKKPHAYLGHAVWAVGANDFLGGGLYVGYNI